MWPIGVAERLSLGERLGVEVSMAVTVIALPQCERWIATHYSGWKPVLDDGGAWGETAAEAVVRSRQEVGD